MTTAIDVNKIQKEAREELAAEKAVRAKALIKEKLIQVDKARKVVKNLEDELRELEADIGNRV